MNLGEQMPSGLVGESLTTEILRDVLERVKAACPDVSVDLFPENPDTYQLTHPTGALLLQYGGGRFEETQSLSVVMQPRELKLVWSVIARQYWQRDGAVVLSERLRGVLVGHRPNHCTRPIYAKNETFLGRNGGVWLYSLELATQMMAIQR